MSLRSIGQVVSLLDWILWSTFKRWVGLPKSIDGLWRNVKKSGEKYVGEVCEGLQLRNKLKFNISVYQTSQPKPNSMGLVLSNGENVFNKYQRNIKPGVPLTKKIHVWSFRKFPLDLYA